MTEPEGGKNPVDMALEAFVDPRGRTDIRFGLDRIKDAMRQLGDPQDKIPPAIHIAGTNGKGSTAAFIRSIAEASGLSAHVFTSPHLIRVNERIRVAGRLVEDEELIYALERVADTGVDLTYFEALTAAAFLIYSQIKADISIIEVGAGGELDSTNIMRSPVACVITSIARDHEQMFGVRGVGPIAKVKAGIMRKHVPVIIGPQDSPEAEDVLFKQSYEIGADAWLYGRDYKARWNDFAFEYVDGEGRIRSPWLGLVGKHQLANAATACAALRSFMPQLPRGSIAAGLREAVWPARLQRLKDGPVTKQLKAAVVVDGAHNPQAAAKLALELDHVTQEHGEKPAVLMAMQANKDAELIMAEIAPKAGLIVTTALPSSGGQEGGVGADPKMLADIARAQGAEAIDTALVDEALSVLSKRPLKHVYVCGSLYLAGNILVRNEEQVA